MPISQEFQTAAFAEETSDGLLVLLTIDNPELEAPIRVVNNRVDIVSNGNDFQAFPFEIILPTNDPDSPPKSQLKIDNITLELTQILRSITTAPTVGIEVVRINNFDAIELEFPPLQLTNIRMDALQITGDLMADDLVAITYPAYSFVPAYFPGIF